MSQRKRRKKKLNENARKLELSVGKRDEGARH